MVLLTLFCGLGVILILLAVLVGAMYVARRA
jgi:hypothetical protein